MISIGTAPRRSVLRVSFCATLYLLSACKDRAGSDGPMPSPTKHPPLGHSVDTGAPPEPLSPKAAAMGPDWTSSKLELLKTKLPAYSSSEVLTPLAILSGSHIAHMTLCIDKDIAEAVKRLTTDFLAKDWAGIEFPTLQHKDKRKIFNAENTPFRINALLSQGHEKGCSREAKRTKAYLSFSLPKKKATPSEEKEKDPKSQGKPGLSIRAISEIPLDARKAQQPTQEEKPLDAGTTGRVPPRTK